MDNSLYSLLVLVSCIITLHVHGYTTTHEMSNSDGITENILENINSTSPGRYPTSPSRYTTSSGSHTTSPGRHTTSSERYTTSSGRHTTSSGRHTTSSERYTPSPGRYTTLHTDASEKQCESGWHSFGERCYKVEGMKEEDRLTFDDAEEFCVEEGGHLASIESNELNRFLVTLIPNGNRPKVWLGLYKEQNKRKFKWTDQTTSRYSNWGSGQPSKKYDSIQEDCVEFYNDGSYGKWNDVNCEMHRTFICQITKGENSNKTKNISGKKKSEDITGKHHKNGWYSFGEMYYKSNGLKVEEWLSWSKAEEFCVQEGGHLASIHSSELNKFLVNLVGNSVHGDAWIGLHDRKVEGIFEWTDKTTVEFLNWAYSEPNGRNRYPGDDCVEIYYHYHGGEKLKWNDAECDARKPFICQKAKVDDTDPDTYVSTEGIIGGAIGSVLVVAIIVAVFTFRSWKRKRTDPEYLNLQPK